MVEQSILQKVEWFRGEKNLGRKLGTVFPVIVLSRMTPSLPSQLPAKSSQEHTNIRRQTFDRNNTVAASIS